MNRNILVVIGLASGLWMLRDLSPTAQPTTVEVAQENAASTAAPAIIAEPSRMAPAIIAQSAIPISRLRPAKADKLRLIETVAYESPEVDDSSPADAHALQSATPSAEFGASDREELGRWATGLLGRLIQKPAVIAQPPATSSIQPVETSTETLRLPTEKSTDNATEKSTDESTEKTTDKTSDETTEIKTETTTEKLLEKTCEKTGEKNAENPAALEKPAVTAAVPDDSIVTDEKPAATEKPVATEKPKAVDEATDSDPVPGATSAAKSTPAPAATIPLTASPASAPKSVIAADPVDEAPSTAKTTTDAASPVEESLTDLAEVTPPRAVAPVAPVRQPLSPAMLQLSQKVRYALTLYQHERLLNTGSNACWEVMHRLVAYGAATEVLRDGPRGEPVNAIGWLLWGGRCNSQPLLVLSGGRPMAMVGVGVQGHPGQFLGMLAQSRVRPESPFQLQGQRFTVRDLIEQEKLGCEANTELTFELIAMSYYLKSDEVWTARTGEKWSISRLISEEIKQPISGAACGGTHRLFGLSCAFKMRLAEDKPLDGEFLRAQKYIHAYQSYALGAIHNRDGSSSTDWLRRPADNGDLDRKIQTTGHVLEWLVFSLEDNQLRDPRVVQSVDFLATQISAYPNRAWSVGPLGHALHALAIYESRVFAQPAAPSQVTMRPEPSRAKPSRPALRPSVGTPNAAAATAELQGADASVTR